MKQGWNWIAAGVIALGVNGVYHDAGAEWARQFVNRSAMVLALASGQGERFVASAQRLSAREEVSACRLQTMVARVRTKIARTQTGLDRLQAMSERQAADAVRLESSRDQLRIEAAKLPFLPVSFSPDIAGSFGPKQIRISAICPRVRVNIPRTFVTVPAPRVHVEVSSSAGPV